MLSLRSCLQHHSSSSSGGFLGTPRTQFEYPVSRLCVLREGSCTVNQHLRCSITSEGSGRFQTHKTVNSSGSIIPGATADFNDSNNGEVSENHEISHTNVNEEGSTKDGIMVKLRRYGVAGVLSYGLLNTFYYLVMFLFAWFYISPAPAGLGYKAAAERFLKLFALVWAGSQVTKLPRAACALAVAPVIDKALTWFTNKSKFSSRSQAFGVIVASCFGIAFTVFLVITFLWA